MTKRAKQGDQFYVQTNEAAHRQDAGASRWRGRPAILRALGGCAAPARHFGSVLAPEVILNR